MNIVFGCLVVVGFCLGLITVVTMPAARGGPAIRTADQPEPQLFNVYVTSNRNKPALSVVACWPSGSALRVSTTAVHWHYNCSRPSVLRDGWILHVSTEPSMNHKR